ncbi:MAG: DUF4432 domain-containing protein [Firmicutes bacterium]|nr:DUF4432 domain-containing protein [Bacillota bacterium]MBO2521078.1 DUF4432 domain-containing protein [Bacillota bacterium]
MSGPFNEETTRNPSYGPGVNARELLRRVGSMQQLAGVREYVLSDGPGRGVRAMRVYNAAGLELEILADRALDIGRAAWKGIPLVWISPAGTVHPAHYEPEGAGWLRVFGGGLLTTCGLTHYGRAEVDGDEVLGLHGRASALPAMRVQVDEAWVGETFAIEVRGEIRESTVFGPNVKLSRRIRTSLWQPGFILDDQVVNEGFSPTEHMLLYHMNFGYPLLDEGTRLAVTRKATRPRDGEAEKGLGQELFMSGPVPGFQEQVFYHDVKADEDGVGRACVYNPNLGEGLAVLIEFDAETMPRLVEWKMLGEGLYVLGVEPGTSFVDGRVAERKAGRVPVLAPGESRRYHLEVTVLTGAEAEAAFRRVEQEGA